MYKNVPEAEETEAQKKATEKKETEKVSTDKPFSGNESSVQEHSPVPEPVISSGQADEPAAKPTPVSKNDTAGTKSDAVTIIFKACHTADDQIIRCLIDNCHMDKHKFIAFCRDRPVISFGFYVAVHRDLNAIVCGGLILLIDLFGGISCLLRG